MNTQADTILTDAEIDAALVNRFKSGEARAFDRLVLRWQQRIYRVAWRYTNTEDEAMDITQNVFVKAWSRIETLDEPERFGSWIYRITHHQCLDYLKAGHKKHVVAMSILGGSDNGSSMQEQVPDNGRSANPQKQLEDLQLRGIIDNALNHIPEEQKMIVILKEYEGLKFREIAEILEIPENTVKSRLYYGLNALRKYFTEHGLTGEVLQS